MNERTENGRIEEMTPEYMDIVVLERRARELRAQAVADAASALRVWIARKWHELRGNGAGQAA